MCTCICTCMIFSELFESPLSGCGPWYCRVCFLTRTPFSRNIKKTVIIKPSNWTLIQEHHVILSLILNPVDCLCDSLFISFSWSVVQRSCFFVLLELGAPHRGGSQVSPAAHVGSHEYLLFQVIIPKITPFPDDAAFFFTCFWNFP